MLQEMHCHKLFVFCVFNTTATDFEKKFTTWLQNLMRNLAKEMVVLSTDMFHHLKTGDGIVMSDFIEVSEIHQLDIDHLLETQTFDSFLSILALTRAQGDAL